ncbi:MAG: hypothetical protein ACXW3G_13080 [Rhodoplanes sp.]
MVMVADFGAPHAAEETLCEVRASAVEAVRLFVTEAALRTDREGDPKRSLRRHSGRALCDPQAKEWTRPDIR